MATSACEATGPAPVLPMPANLNGGQAAVWRVGFRQFNRNGSPSRSEIGPFTGQSRHSPAHVSTRSGQSAVVPPRCAAWAASDCLNKARPAKAAATSGGPLPDAEQRGPIPDLR